MPQVQAAPIVVEIPGVGEVEFPASMAQADIEREAARLHREAQGRRPASRQASRLDDPRMATARTAIDVGKGALKGAGRTLVGLGRLAHKVPGVSEAIDKLYELVGGGDIDSGRVFGEERRDLRSLVAGQQPPVNAEAAFELDATNRAQKVGMALEQLAEFFVPAGAGQRAATAIASKIVPKAVKYGKTATTAARIAPRIAVEAGTSAGVTAAQGGDPATAAVAGAALPVVGKVAAATGRAIGRKAVPLVRAAIKPTVTEIKQSAGASIAGLNAVEERLSKFILKHRLTTPEKAQAMITEAEQELQATLTAANASTDAPLRAKRYLQALERSAKKQGLPADDVATIRSAARELVEESPFGETVQRTVRKPSPSGLVDASGRPVMVDVVEDLRALRSSMPAQEALETARGSSRWRTRKSWGEQKGASMEAAKGVERAARDAVKTAVPATRPILQRQGQAIQSRRVLDRMAFRQANRDVASMPATITAGVEVASGRVPILGFAANWLRNNQMKAGIWADQLATAIRRKDVRKVSDILGRLGVASTAQTTKPAAAR